MTDAFICDAMRTPIGSFGGALAAVRADDLAAHVIKALLARQSRLDPAAIDDVILGCATEERLLTNDGDLFEFEFDIERSFLPHVVTG